MAVRLCFLVWRVVPLVSLVAGLQPLQYAERGLQTTLGPQLTAGAPERILWTHGARKVVEFDGSEENVYGTFLDRVVLDWHTAELTIKELQGSDSGAYELQATVNRKVYYSEHDVAVIDKVAVPTISCIINGTEGSGDGGDGSDTRSLAELRCSAEGPPSLITYDWMLVSGVRRGAALDVALQGEQDDTVYTCRATNPVSQETGTFVVKDCYPDNFPYTGLIIGIIAICLLLVLAECFWCYRKWKKAHPKPNAFRDVEKPQWRPTQGPAGGTHDEDKERESLLHNGATLPSTQPLSLLAHIDQDSRPLDSTSEQQQEEEEEEEKEKDTTNSGGLCNSSRLSVHSSETNLQSESVPQHHLADLESKCSSEDSVCDFEKESESNPPSAAPIGGCGLHPVVVMERGTAERPIDDGRVEQAPVEPEERHLSGTPEMPGTPPPSDESASDGEPQQEDGEASHLASTCLEEPQSLVLKTADGITTTTNPMPRPSPVPPPETSASDTWLDTTTTTTPPPPPPQPEDHRGSDDEGRQEPAAVAVALREEEDAPGPLVPLSIVGSPEEKDGEEEEEEEEGQEEERERSDTGVESCVSTWDEPSSDECAVATHPQVNVEAPAPKDKTEEVNDRKLPHGATAEVPEQGEEEEGDSKDRGVAASLPEPASEPAATFRDSEESDTDTSKKNKEDTHPGMPEDNHHHDDGTDVTEHGTAQTLERLIDDRRVEQAPAEPEERHRSGTPGTAGTPPPSDESASDGESQQEDGKASHLASTCLEEPQSLVLKTADGTTTTTNPGPSPSPVPPPEISASDTWSNPPDKTTNPPPPQPAGHLCSDDEGCQETGSSPEPTTPEPAAVAVVLREEEDEHGHLVPLSIDGEEEDEEEGQEEERERSDTGVESCVSTGDEPSSDEFVAVAAATHPQVNVEAPAPKDKTEEEVNDRKLPHGATAEVPEQGEEGDSKDRGVAASLPEPASEPAATFRDSEESDTDTSKKNKEDTHPGTPEDNHHHGDGTDVMRQGAVSRAEPEKQEEEMVHDDTEVQDEGEGGEGGGEGGTTSLMEMKPAGPETRRQNSTEPGERWSDAAGAQEETKGEDTEGGRTHEETVVVPGETDERPLSETPDEKEAKKGEGNQTNTKTEVVTE